MNPVPHFVSVPWNFMNPVPHFVSVPSHMIVNPVPHSDFSDPAFGSVISDSGTGEDFYFNFLRGYRSIIFLFGPEVLASFLGINPTKKNLSRNYASDPDFVWIRLRDPSL